MLMGNKFLLFWWPAAAQVYQKFKTNIWNKDVIFILGGGGKNGHFFNAYFINPWIMLSYLFK